MEGDALEDRTATTRTNSMTKKKKTMKLMMVIATVEARVHRNRPPLGSPLEAAPWQASRRSGLISTR